MPHTVNFKWETTNLIAVGGFSRVYKGTARKNAQSVAIKTFRVKVKEYMQREADILALTNHENIVKLIGFETRMDTIMNEHVLIMELCDGNLVDLIDGTTGLNCTEFLRVCKHLKTAVKYLRDNDIIHRDIKPENILTSKIGNDQIIYKLADFGSARILKSNESYTSMHGTFEYMHPDIFEKLYESALYIKYPPQSFEATHDLWSIGATLYHAATGKVPFLPKNGRDDIGKMHEMISKKEDNISAMELDDGQIVWSNKLPGFEDEIAAFLAGLLRADKENLWTFDQFFHEADRLTAKIDSNAPQEQQEASNTSSKVKKHSPKQQERSSSKSEVKKNIPKRKAVAKHAGDAKMKLRSYGKMKQLTAVRRKR